MWKSRDLVEKFQHISGANTFQSGHIGEGKRNSFTFTHITSPAGWHSSTHKIKTTRTSLRILPLEGARSAEQANP